MAGAFLTQLVTIELREDESCMICMEAYGATLSENRAELPRKPCITIRLSPENSSQNSCPYCRCELFVLTQKGKNVDDEDEEEDEPAWRYRLWRKEWDVVQGTLNTQGNTTLEAQWLQWRRDWNTAATRLEQGSMERATAARNLLQTQLGLSQGFFDGLGTEWPIAEVALSLQTMRFRECRLYNQFAAGSSQYLQTPPDRSISKNQER
ncbi:hypothetical protein HO173_003354 [Letharia columbiana]|uniref:Uncharacterized protein n=1 Tax=Letharia columbiana TaxID=112416 RepID=A0A8H6G123_9LECA|nr:uncharacterized protein HO173_003354 [Letharia columbiana]KAF6238387.1 hypothetical protein HO173_003354 [Letharia columbiana]